MTTSGPTLVSRCHRYVRAASNGSCGGLGSAFFQSADFVLTLALRNLSIATIAGSFAVVASSFGAAATALSFSLPALSLPALPWAGSASGAASRAAANRTTADGRQRVIAAG